MPNLSGRFPISYPGPTAALVPWQDHFSDQAQSIADILNGYQLPLAVADATDRAAKFPSPSAGDRVFRLDTRLVQVYHSGAWKNLPSRFVGAQVFKNQSTSVVTALTTFTWNTSAADFDTDGLYSTGANTRLTIPTGFGGLWRITYNLRSSGTTAVSAFLNKNGSNYEVGNSTNVGAAGAGTNPKTSVIVEAVAGDYFEVQTTSAAASGAWGNTSAPYGSWFMAEYLGEI